MYGQDALNERLGYARAAAGAFQITSSNKPNHDRALQGRGAATCLYSCSSGNGRMGDRDYTGSIERFPSKHGQVLDRSPTSPTQHAHAYPGKLSTMAFKIGAVLKKPDYLPILRPRILI